MTSGSASSVASKVFLASRRASNLRVPLPAIPADNHTSGCVRRGSALVELLLELDELRSSSTTRAAHGTMLVVGKLGHLMLCQVVHGTDPSRGRKDSATTTTLSLLNVMRDA